MRLKILTLILTGLILSLMIFIGACRRATTPEFPTQTSTALISPVPPGETPAKTSIQTEIEPTRTVSIPTTESAYPMPAEQTSIPYPQPSSQVPNVTVAQPSITATIIPTTQPPQFTQTLVANTPTATATMTQVSAYPGPGANPTNPPGQAYPAPLSTNTQPAYPGPGTSTAQPTQTPRKSATPTSTSVVTKPPSVTPTPGTGTPLATPTEQPPRPPLSPPPAGSSVTIWHSWSFTKTEMLMAVIQSFKKLYPDVTFNLLYVPLDDLYDTYHEAAYLGQGPSLLLGSSNWGPDLFDEDLITDLRPYVPENYLVNISPPAMTSGEYQDALISLPLSQHGLLLFRNNVLITTAPTSMDELITLSKQATRSGNVGSYLERGSYFSSPAILGLGGSLMDENGYPEFNDDFGLEWIELLEDYDVAGAVTFNTNWDLEKFKQSKVGIIIDGSWNIAMLAQSIGVENLIIDPWPTYGTGHMAGWVETDSIYLNSNTTGNNQYAALSFMGYLLDPNVQMRFAEVGDIPSVMTTQPRDPLIKLAMTAFEGGAPYPITQDESVLSIYWNELDKAIKAVFYEGVDPATALQTAADNITEAINDMKEMP